MQRIPEPIREALKEAGRIILLGLISFAIASIADYPQTETTALILLVLRSLDKWMHEQGKQNKNPALSAGLTRF